MLDSRDYIIEKNPVRPDALNYQVLRSYGLGYIQKLSSKLWTDHNIHDPGITILEMLCYALTDLGYRTSFDMQDILTPAGKKGPEMKHAFHPAKKILTSHPVTINDYRKFILDRVPGVRNVWFEIQDQKVYCPAIGFDATKKENLFVNPVSPGALKLKGLYHVKVELEDYGIISQAHKNFLEKLKKYKENPNTDVGRTNYKKCYKNYIHSLLMSCRNICEDFEKVSILDDYFIGICADIELKPQAKDQHVLAEIYRKLYEYINPSIRFYTIQQLLDKGRSIEQIFQGPVAERGFIDYEELMTFDRKTVLHISDLINSIMDIEGVLNIRSIQFNTAKDNDNKNLKNKSCLHLADCADPEKYSFRFRFDIDFQSDNKLNKIIFRKGMIYYQARPTKDYKITEVIDYAEKSADFENDLPEPSGTNRELDNYISLQDEFPKAYMTGREGIPNSAGELRKAQRLQLKAYLLFFDQLLADYLAQLDSVKDMLSWRDVDAEETYNYKKLTNEIFDLDKILSEELLADYDKYQAVIEHVKVEKNRRNRLLDHLLARFNEKFVDYTVFKFVQNAEGSSYDNYANNELIHDKKDMLKHYPAMSGNRSHAIDYTHPLSAKNFAMPEFRISKALGVDADDSNRLLAPEVVDNNPAKMIFENNSAQGFDKTFGLHIYEHILFRPLFADAAGPKHKFLKLYYGDAGTASAKGIITDPYSMKATVVVPGWLNISARMEFRSFVEQKIRMEMPAHVALKICWIDPRQMWEMETKFKKFVDSLNDLFIPANTTVEAVITAYRTALNEVVAALSSLNNMYPPSALDELLDFVTGNAKHTPVILDNTALAGGNDRNWAFDDENAAPEPVPKKKTVKKKKTTVPKKVNSTNKKPK